MRQLLDRFLALASHKVDLPAWALVFIALTILVLILAAWSLKRRRDPKFHHKTSFGFPEMLPSVVGATHASLVEGNDIKLYQNGAFFDVLKEALRAAQQSITFETFLWKPGKLSAEISDILAERARAGLAVRLMVDGRGGHISKDEEKKMLDAGCRIGHFHPTRISNLGILNNRDHRKIVVVDGRIGFVGGHCIVDDWLGDGEDKKHFRDASVRVEGPVVADLQSAFLENWVEETGEVLLGDRFFPELGACGKMAAHAVYVSPAGSSSSIEILHYVAIQVAKTKIRIQNPYFVPDPEMIRALTAAAKRGVDVRVMLPSAEASDSPLVQHASHHRFGELLEGGVRIFEFKRTLLHQKVMTIDGCWTSVGSANFDDRSFELNDEVTLGVNDESLAAEFEAMFEKDLAHCSEYTLEHWKHRGPLHKLRDFATFLINEQL